MQTPGSPGPMRSEHVRMPTPSTKPESGEAAVALRSVRKVYGRGSSAVPALGGRVGIDLDLLTGSFTAIMGQSGSGKSTLLHCAAGLDRPTSGEVWWSDTPV